MAMLPITDNRGSVGAADFDVNEPTLSAAGGSSMSGLTVADASMPTKALGTIDNAIDTVNSIRAILVLFRHLVQ